MNIFDELPVNWVDIAILAFLILGIFRGRKHGMSQELLLVAQWLTIIFIAAFGYEAAGRFLVSVSVFSLLFSFIVSYLAIVIAAKVIFSVIKRLLGGKLIGSDIFGSGEYYLGMFGGLLRYVCMVIFVMALLNAKLVTEAEAKSTVASQIKLYDKDYFSLFRVEKIQSEVFANSISGRFVKEQLGSLLISPTASENKELHIKDANLP